MTEYASPWMFTAFILVPLIIALYWRRDKMGQPTVIFPPAAVLAKRMSFLHRQLRHLPIVLRVFALSALIIALARPQETLVEEKVSTEGIDLVMALDISTSMLAEDLKPKNRITAAKNVAREFISGRTSDRIALVMFAGEAYTWCPLTLDYDVLVQLMDKVSMDMVIEGAIKDGTGIGKAVATSANRLRDSNAKSKVIILLTDGVNNVDQPDPLTAARAATEVGIRIYTIGVGTEGTARYPFQTQFGIQYQNVKVEIDEELLQKIADMSGGQYFRATSTEGLRRIYERIDELEKTEIDVQHFKQHKELFYYWAALALLLLMIERILVLTRLRNLAL